MSHADYSDEQGLFGVAVIGMAARFPGANTVDEFWHNLEEGIESIRPFTAEELTSSGVSDATRSDPRFVNAGAPMPDADRFDASFFDINAREAETMDPQHRALLETAWEALEDAGYDPQHCPGSVGLFAGVGPNTYFHRNLATRPEILKLLGRYGVLLATEKEYAVTRVSFKLNLTGPSVSVNTACSTSGVTIHMACQSLLNGECDMALAGGGRILVPLTAGYLYEEGGIPSPDGHCRAFDAQARGTVGGSGVGLVVLRRLSEAIEDGDHIYAVITSSAINNDGALKVGFTAPSIRGQAAVIQEALAVGDISPDTIGYVEAHGTGTSLGDPIEIAALTQAYRQWTDRKAYCPIGSVKTNIGHLDAGAGVAGVIKAVLALKHGQIPPSLHFSRPNPEIDFANSPFYVNTELRPWPAACTPRRAAVSSFGLGGTNAHIVLEEAPRAEPSARSRPYQLLLLSARSDAALTRATENLTEHLQRHPDINLADVAFTLQTGRRAFGRRRMLVCKDADDALSALDPVDPKRVITSTREALERDVVFMFPGQGSQYVDMGLGLYQSEPAFREQVDRCSEILKPHLSHDLRHILYPRDADQEKAAQILQRTSFTQPALFVIEVALARLWLSWGIHPRAMVGHSIGEYVAACLAGVFSLEDALSLVATRGRLIQSLPAGSMLAVSLSPHELQPLLDGRADLAVINTPSLCVVSGTLDEIEGLEGELAEREVDYRQLHTSHAFHSRMMEPIVEPFAAQVGRLSLRPPAIPFVSNVSGTWIRPEEATSPSYWAAHLRRTVRFADCLQRVLDEPTWVLLEVGPGCTLGTLARQHPERSREQVVLSSIRHPKEQGSDQAFVLSALGQLWMAGAPVDWSGFYVEENRHRVPLPTYPFERKRYWISPADPEQTVASAMPRLSEELEEISAVAQPYGIETVVSSGEGGPRNAIEQSLAELWQELLGVESLTIQENFFDLGGSSLLATRLFTQIAIVFGKKLPLATIFRAPTIEQLASLLEQEAPPPTESSLVRIQEGRSRPALYVLPGNLGNVFTDLGDLAQHLGADQPVYGLQDGLGHPSKVEALAAHYVDEVSHMQSVGPYCLAGICSGGVVAFEMAQQFVQRGERVAFLALIEPAALSLPAARSYSNVIRELWVRGTQGARRYSDNASDLDRLERIVYLRLKMKVVANIWALKDYYPQSYPGRLDLFLTRESIERSHRPDWCKFATEGTRTHEIPGTHRSITGDRVEIEEWQMQVLGEKLRASMDDVLRGTYPQFVVHETALAGSVP